MEIILSCEGHEVTAVKDGGCALELAQSLDFNLVISDEDMPFINGLELTEMLRNLPDYTATPIFILSKRTDRFKPKGIVTQWIRKPFHPDEILNNVRSLT